MGVGLQRGLVALQPYDQQWAAAFESEKRLLRHIFASQATAIEHVGSTAIPGLAAKPIIDIEVGLKDFSRWREYVAALESAGYTYMPERVQSDQVFMPKGPEEARTHYLHMTQFGSAEWWQTVRFRDALRGDKTLCVTYEQLKRQLAAAFPRDRAKYSEGKAAFIRRVISGS